MPIFEDANAVYIDREQVNNSRTFDFILRMLCSPCAAFSEIQVLKERLQTLESILTSSSTIPLLLADVQGSASQSIATGWTQPASNRIRLVSEHSQNNIDQSMAGESTSKAAGSQPVDGMGAVLLENEEVLTFFGKAPCG